MTAELAVALPGVVLVLAAVLATASVGSAQLRCQDGARAGARLAALGEEDGRVVAAARRAAGDGVAVAVSRADGWAEVTVTGDVPGPWSGAGLTPRASATAWIEP